MCNNWKFSSPGIPESLFLRRENIPITAAETRAVVISKLRLYEGITAYDVGAGSGSVAVEMGLQVKKGRVFALERRPDAAALIKENVKHFGLANVEVLNGDAADTLMDLPPAHRIFIGGSGGKLAYILALCHRKLLPGGIMVATSVTLDTAPRVFKFLQESGYRDIEAVQLNTAKTTGAARVNIWRANNPVTIISGRKTGD